MSSPLGAHVWIFHAGALGDHVMIWPLVRALARQGAVVTMVAAPSHARLCEREVNASLGAGAGRVVGVSAEQERFLRLWRGPEDVRPEDVVAGVTGVVSFVATLRDAAGKRWHTSAARMFPRASIALADRPDREDGARQRAELWRQAGLSEHGLVVPCANSAGPIVIYPGAGSASKRLSTEQWVDVARRLLAKDSLRDATIDVVLGRNELEGGARAEPLVDALGSLGRVREVRCPELLALSDHLRSARIVIGPDTGPLHLSAQLGVPTLAIFGPTDPSVWSPVGPRVRVLAAKTSGAITHIEPERIVREVVEMAAG